MAISVTKNHSSDLHLIICHRCITIAIKGMRAYAIQADAAKGV